MDPKQDSHNLAHKTERRLNTRLLPILFGLFTIFYGLTDYRGWLVLSLGIGGVWLLAVIWVYALEYGLSIDRKIHLAWASVGDSVPEEVLIKNKSGFPAIWLEITDESSMLAEPLRLVSDVEPHGVRRRNLVHLFNRRGLYTLGPTRLRTGDPFGIYTLILHDQHSSTILVTPPQLPLSQLRVPPSGWAGGRKRRREVLEREISDVGIRDYVPGDSLRRIHWHATAHHDALIVRQLEAAASGDWWIFVDLNKAAQAGTGQDSTLELSVVLAASLAMRALKERRRVGLALIGPNLVWLEPRADSAHRWRILRALAMADAGERSLTDLLTVGQPARSASLIVITPTSDPAWVAISTRHRGGGSMIAFLVDPIEFGGRFNQSQVISALARSGIPCTRTPKSLLEEAYGSFKHKNRMKNAGTEVKKRYLEQSRSAWQSMD